MTASLVPGCQQTLSTVECVSKVQPWFSPPQWAPGRQDLERRLLDCCPHPRTWSHLAVFYSGAFVLRIHLHLYMKVEVGCELTSLGAMVLLRLPLEVSNVQ